MFNFTLELLKLLLNNIYLSNFANINFQNFPIINLYNNYNNINMYLFDFINTIY